MTTSFCLMSQDGRIDQEDYVSSHTRQYLGINSSSTATDTQVISDFLSFAGPIGSAYPSDSRASLKTVQANQRDVQAPYNWNVTANWTSKSPDPDNNKANPLEVAAKISYSFEDLELVQDYDIAGNLVVNSAGEKFLNMPSTNFQVTVVRIEVNQPTSYFNAAHLRTVTNAVNNAAWNGFATDTVLVAAPEATQEFQKDIGKYFHVTYSLKILPDVTLEPSTDKLTWQTRILDCGFNEVLGANPDFTAKYSRIYDDKTGAPVTEPYPLRNGLKLQQSEPFEYRHFQGHKKIDFSTYFPFTI